MITGDNVKVVSHARQSTGVNGTDAGGWELEEFGLPLNLMLAVPCVMVVGDAEAALQRLRADLDARRSTA